MRRWLAAAVVAAVSSGCTDTEFTPRWRVDRFRVLGVRVEPPDARPGERVTLTLVSADAPGVARPVAVAWQPCAALAIDNSTGGRGCEASGVAPLLGSPASMVMPAQPQGGAPWTVFGFACAGGALGVDPATGAPRCAGGEGEVFLRSVRPRGATANHNPRIARVTLDGAALAEAAPTRVAGCALTGDEAREAGCPGRALAVEFADDAREVEEAVEADGRVVRRPEALVTQFLVDGGDLAGAFRSDNDVEGAPGPHRNVFRAPPSGTVRLWVLVRDGRGGFDAVTRTLTVAP